MADILSFVFSVLHHWFTLAGGAAIVTVVGIWERWRKHETSWRRYAVMLLGFILVASFLAWRDEHTKWSEVDAVLAEARKELSASKSSNLEKDQRIGMLEVMLHRQPAVLELSSVPREPEIGGITFTSTLIPSADDNNPFGLKVIVQTKALIQPFDIRVECDGLISHGKARLIDAKGFFTGEFDGVTPANKKVYRLAANGMSFAPERPLHFELYSAKQIRVVRVTNEP